jgi:hypothetical protein
MIEGIMAELPALFGKVRQYIIDLAGKKILAVIQTGDSLYFGLHVHKLTDFLSTLNRLVLRKSLLFKGLSNQSTLVIMSILRAGSSVG